jgi:hypothetical protein
VVALKPLFVGRATLEGFSFNPCRPSQQGSNSVFNLELRRLKKFLGHKRKSSKGLRLGPLPARVMAAISLGAFFFDTLFREIPRALQASPLLSAR